MSTWKVEFTDTPGESIYVTDPSVPVGNKSPHAVAKVDTLENAFLIAAAKDMLAVLRDITDYVSPGNDIPLAAMLDDARAVIAKATVTF